MLKIKFDRLDYQELAVNSISDVFKTKLNSPELSRLISDILK